MDCLEHWLYYGHPVECPFKKRQRVCIVNPHTGLVDYTGTIYRLEWHPRVREPAYWAAGVKVTDSRRHHEIGRLYLTNVKHLVLDKGITF